MFPVEKLTNIVNQLQRKSVTTDYFACLSLILQLIGLVIGPVLIVIGFYVGLYLIKKKLISILDKDAPINVDCMSNVYINNYLSLKRRMISKEDMSALKKEIEEWIGKVRY